jgi:hypothetical protein
VGWYDFEDATRFVLIDSESGKIKKDMELGEYIKPNGEKGDYQGAFFYSDNGDKLHLRKSIHDASSGQYSVLDLNTGKISSSYIYSCDELIKNKEGIKARCSNKLKSFYDFGVYYNGIGEGLLFPLYFLLIHHKSIYKKKKFFQYSNLRHYIVHY